MHYVMTDIHGDYQRFIEMLDEVQFSEDDRLYLIGDVIDRGTENLEMLDFCMRYTNVFLIKGNHEYFMELTGRHPDFAMDWRRFGGRNTLRQLDWISEEERAMFFEYVENLPWYMVLTPEEVPELERPYLLTHTGFLMPDDSMRGENVPAFCIPDFTGKTAFDVERAVDWMSRHYTWEYSISSDLYDLPETVRFDKRLLVGHIPVNSGHAFPPIPYMLERREYMDLDCGAAYRSAGGRMGCLRLEDMKIWYL